MKLLILGMLMPFCGTAMAANAYFSSTSAASIFKKDCVRCHGKDSAGEGGFQSIDDVNELIAKGYVVPGNPDDSPLFKKISTGAMPPAGETPRPTATDKEVIKKWIETLQTDTPDDPDSDPRETTIEKMYSLIKADVLSVPGTATQRKSLRYLTMRTLANAKNKSGTPLYTDADLDQFRKGMFKLLNSVSSTDDIFLPTEVAGSHGTIWRINLKDFGIKEETWTKLSDSYQFDNHGDSDDAHHAIATLLGFGNLSNKNFEMRADWFVAHVSVPPFYYDFLDIKENYIDQALSGGVDIDKNLKSTKATRAGFLKSGISKQNRVVERHEMPRTHGAFWVSYDFGSVHSLKKDITLNPLGPIPDYPEKFAFEQDGGEILWNLANGLQGYMLADKSGGRLAKASTEIVQDPQRPDNAVIAGLSCMSCHTAGMKHNDDILRDTIENNFDDGPLKTTMLNLYKPNDVMKGLMAADQQRFEAALAKLDIDPLGPEPILSVVKQYESPVTLEMAAAELDLTKQELSRKIREINNNDLAELCKKLTHGGMPRENFDEMITILGVGF